MIQVDDLSRSLIAFEQISTLVIVVTAGAAHARGERAKRCRRQGV
jgi:hypothetical protein